jgi:thiol-disulfide isomerase/thioredoxin
MNVIELENEEDLAGFVADPKVVLKFGATWCGPCVALDEWLEEKKDDGLFPGVTIVKIDVNEFGETALEYGVSGIPLLVHCESGEKIVGANVGKISQLLTKISSPPSV